jgi:hypothetical protein
MNKNIKKQVVAKQQEMNGSKSWIVSGTVPYLAEGCR